MKKLMIICVMGILILGLSPIMEAATLEVGPPKGGVSASGDIHVYPFTTIQAAISYAEPGDMIIVHEGTYNEQVHIYKLLTVTSAPGELVVIDPNGAEFEGPRAGDDKVRAAVLFETGSTGAVLKDVTIQNSQGSELNGNGGIEIIDGDIDDVTIEDVIVDVDNGHGFGSYHTDHTWPPPSGWIIKDCNFSTTGTAASGTGGTAGTSGMRPQNMENLTVQDCDIGPTNYGGILLVNVNDGVVQRCDIHDTQRAGIQVDAYCTGTIDVLDNEVWNANLSGTSGYSDIRLYSTQQNPHANTPATITISGNTLRDGVNGIYVKPGDLSTRTSVVVEENKIINHSNYGALNDATGVLDAEHNWWGDATGPYHPVTNPVGLGDEVSDNVNYDPWWADEDGTIPGTNPVQNITKGTSYNTIQAAVDDADPGDTITVVVWTYSESVTIGVDNLTVIGEQSSRPAITGGLKLDTNLTGLTFKNFVVSGNAVAGKNSVVRMYGAITDITIDNCVFDGEYASDRNGFSGGQLEGDVSITNSEFKNILGWSVLDSRSGSGGDGSAMGTVTFANNDIHNCNGSIVFRGLSTDRTDVVNAYGNTWNDIGGNNLEQGQHWAALEINRTVQANVYDNEVNGVSEGQWGEGQAIQLWDIDTLDVHDNTLTNNFQGIYIFGSDPIYGGALPVPGGSIYCNLIVGNADYGISVDPTATSGPLDAENNWWGDASGPSGEGGGTGDVVSENVDFFPWLLSEDCNDYTELLADIVVDDDWGVHPDWYTVTVGGKDYYIGLNAFAVIQDAVEVADPCDIIYVLDGSYEPFTVDAKSELTITSGSVVLIEGVQSVTTAYGPRDCVVFVKDSTNVVLNDLNIEGDGLGTINTKNYGVIIESSSGSIKNCNVSPNAVGNMSSTAIGIWDGSEMTVDSVLLHNFGRIGILVYNGCTVEILESTIEGQVYAGEGEVCYGIEVEGAYADDNPDTASVVVIKRNEIYNCDNTFDPEPSWASSAIYINGWMAYYPEADSTVTVTDNDIYNNYNAIYVVNSHSSSASLNNIFDNRTTGVESAAAHDDTTTVFNAEYNWWGDVSGPNDPCGTDETDGTTCYDVSTMKNEDGLGDAVSEYVDYCPWLLAPVVSSDGPLPLGDLNGDGCVNFEDFAIWADNWLEGCE